MDNLHNAPLTRRHQRILEIVEKQSIADVGQLSEALGVSTVTIRSDLDALDKRLLLRRVRGGAMAMQAARFERPVDIPTHSFTTEKERIGAAAAGMVRSGETIILDAGTTTLAMAMALPQDIEDVVVITSSLDIAIALEKHAGTTVFVTGGKLKKSGRNPNSRSMVPPLAGLLLDHLNADVAYLCCAGIDAERGFTNANLEEAEVKRFMISAARQCVMLADRGKIGHVAGARIAPIQDISTLVTDRKANPTDVSELQESGLKVILA